MHWKTASAPAPNPISITFSLDTYSIHLSVGRKSNVQPNSMVRVEGSEVILHANMHTNTLLRAASELAAGVSYECSDLMEGLSYCCIQLKLVFSQSDAASVLFSCG